MFNTTQRRGFTLVELLIVIGILASLAVAVVVVLNPAEMLKSARDTTRLSDMATLNSALSLYNTDRSGAGMGTSNIIYTSLPDTSGTCASWNLPTISGYTYNCVTQANLTKTDGTGWIPVNFTLISGGTSPIPRLPIDPTNASSTGQYYTYVGGSWALSAILESTKYAPQMASDGGRSSYSYEIGSDLSLAPTALLNRTLPRVGSGYQGGVVAYILQPSDFGYNASTQHGIIVSTSDLDGAQSGQATWGCWGSGWTMIGNTTTTLGYGNTNTTNIINGCALTLPPAALGRAASLARSYNGGGFSDWYLPSKDELNQLYLNRALIGNNFQNYYYWSSSEDAANANNAWTEDFSNGNQPSSFKGFNMYVRAVRSF